MSDDKKRDRALQRRVHERQGKTGESYQAAWRSLTGDEPAGAVGLPRRIPLPLGTEAKILPGQSAQITARPQAPSFWPDRLLIKNAESWTIQQLTVENKPGPKRSLIGTADQDAAVFSYATWHPLSAQEALCGEPIVLVVTYRGSEADGERFEAVLFGWEDCLPAKDTNVPNSRQRADRISERATSPAAQPAQFVKLPWTIATPTLFVDRVTIADAKNWIVNDIRTRGKSIFVQSGDVPAAMFSDAADVILEPLKKGDLVFIVATYIGQASSAKLTVELSGTASAPSVPQARSYFLPVSTDPSVCVLPTQSVQITGRPQMAFLLERLVIADSTNWIVNDIKIGNASRFAQAGDVPALAFDSCAVGNSVALGTVQAGMDFVVVATPVQGRDKSAPFFCGVQGRIAEEHASPMRAPRARSAKIDGDKIKYASFDKPRLVLALTPSEENAHRVGPPIPRIPPNQKTRVVVRPLDGAFVIENLFISNGAPGGDWIVNEIEIDGQPQRVPKDIPGTLFRSGSSARISFAGLDVVERDRELAVTVTYVGPPPEGVFFAAVTGSRPAQNPTAIPIAVRDPVLPASRATIRLRVSEPSAFQIERFVIEDGDTEGGSADWIVNDLRIANVSQFVQSGDIPGDLFATNAIDTFVKFDAWPVNATIEITVTYIGLRKDGALFRARLEGTVVRDDYDTPPPDLSVLVETVGQGAGAVVTSTCNFRPPATSNSRP